MPHHFLVYAHRGASAAAPENTMTAFRKALEMGSQGIECDVQLTKDGHLVVCHDERLERTTNGKGFLKDMDLSTLKTLDAGSWFNKAFKGETIPQLHELLNLVRDKGCLLNIEIKSGIIIYPEIEEKVIAAIKEYKLEGQVVISSFNHYSIYKIKKLAPHIKTGALYMEGLFEPWSYLKTVNCDYAHPFYLTLKPEIISGYRSRGFGINAFTVDDPDIAKQLVAAGVEGIITNRPDIMLKSL